MSKTVLLVYAHPEPTSLTRLFVAATEQTLTQQGHTLLQSDLYSMGWKAVFDEQDFPHRSKPGAVCLCARVGARLCH